MARIPIPDPYSHRAFHVREPGLGEGRLRGPDLRRPFRGVRSATPVAHPAFDYVPLLRPGERFSHSTAAWLWDAPLPRSEELAVHLTVAGRAAHSRSSGVIGHRSDAGTTVARQGLPVSDPATLFVECAALLTLDDLVAIGDHLVLAPRFLDRRDPRPHATVDDLHRAAARASGRGALRARTAAALTRAGAESPAETRLRLLLQRAGLPEPELGGVLHDLRGDRIGWFDLVYRPYRVAVEYDGDQHRTSVTQYDRDIRRFDRAHESRWTVVRVRSRGLTHEPRETIRRVREALRRGGWVS